MIHDKTILLIGGAGFIGTKIAERLVAANRIIIYDNFVRDSIGQTALPRHARVRILRGDALDFDRVREAAQGANLVFHLAAIAGIDTVSKSPTQTMRTNIIGTANALEASQQAGTCQRFVFFSTSEVFGTVAYKLHETEATSTGAVGEARWTYAVGKLAGEHLANAYHKEFGLPVVCVRPFNVYGPGQVGEGALHHFVVRALLGDDLEIHGDGDQIRSWCYIDDFVDGVLLCAENRAAVGQVFNIGNPRGTTTILALAQTVIRICASTSRIRFVPRRFADVELRVPSIEKSQHLLGFEPHVDLEEGIARTAAWYRRILGDARAGSGR